MMRHVYGIASGLMLLAGMFMASHPTWAFAGAICNALWQINENIERKP